MNSTNFEDQIQRDCEGIGSGCQFDNLAMFLTLADVDMPVVIRNHPINRLRANPAIVEA